MATKSVFVVTNVAATTKWTPENDVLLVGVLVRADTRFGGDSVNVAIAAEPEVQVTPMWQTPGIYLGNIAVITAETGFFPLDYPLGKGQSVYFSADGFANINLFFVDSQVS